MEIKLINRIIDDNGKECKEGTAILLQTKNMNDMSVAIIQQISTLYFTVIFDDKTIGYDMKKIRKEDVTRCQFYKEP